MGVVQRVGHFDGELEHRVNGQLAVGVEPVSQGLPLHERHDEVQGAVSFARVVQREHMGMIQPGGELGFANETVPRERRTADSERSAVNQRTAWQTSRNDTKGGGVARVGLAHGTSPLR